MAASAFIHSKLSKFSIDTAGGVLTDISDSCEEVGFPEELELLDVTTFGQTSKQYMVGFADAKITISGPWNRNLHTHLSALKTAFRDGTINSASFQYGPEGADSGDIKLTGECVMVNYEKSSSVKDPVKFSAEFQVTGAVTETTF